MNKLSKTLRSFNSLIITNQRNISVSSALRGGDDDSKKPGLLNRILRGDQFDYPTNAHSVLLANPDYLYKYQIHDVKPSRIGDYHKLYNEYVPKLLKKYPDLKLTGAWKSQIGVLDKYVHIYRYDSYLEYQKIFDQLQTDKDHVEFKNETLKLVNRREHQLCLGFTFWGDIPERDTPHIYELRSYALKPGTLIEWGNNWQRGIRTRFDSRVLGLFTQVGPLYWVHHMWAYKNLQARKDTRENAWSKPGWDECVSYTVPLIRKMESKILTALPYSPLK